MKYGEYKYIWQADDWPHWQYDLTTLAPLLSRVSLTQGRLLGRLTDAGFDLQGRVSLDALTSEVVKTSAIEGQSLNVESVRSSIARRLGLDIGSLAPVDRHVEGVVEMALDATSNSVMALTRERLFGWHAALFPTGYSGLSRIRVGMWRDDAKGAMQVVSGPLGRQRVHFQAPPARCLEQELEMFLGWVNNNEADPALIKAGVGHLWFVTLHPFDDGNGRIARAIGDLLLARADGSPQRFYSLAAQIDQDRKNYYDILEQTQKSGLDVTPWLIWFFESLNKAVDQAQGGLDRVFSRARFWNQFSGLGLNKRQVKLLNRLLDGFSGNMTSKRWASIGKCSQDTALRDIKELIRYGILRKSRAGGRSTCYELKGMEDERIQFY